MKDHHHPDDLRIVSKGTLATACLCVLTALAVIGALIVGKAVLAPMTLAFVLGVVVSPVVEALVNRGAPRILLTIAMVWLIIASIVGLLWLIEPAFTTLMQLLPGIIEAIRDYMSSLSSMFEGLKAIDEDVDASPPPAEDTLTEQMPSLGEAIWLAPNFGAQFLIFVGTLFFFVLTRNDIYNSLPRRTDIIRKADRAVSRYFAAVTAVNMGLGVVTAAVMALIGVEYPWAWGLAAGLLNFILYLGPICIMGGLFIAGFMQFGGAYAFVPPLAFFIINATEAQFVTPLIVGQHVSVNPLFVFLSIITGLWIWGPVGAIVALPLVIWVQRIVTPETS